MTLIVALLREDHIIVAGDRRHTRGDNNGRYRDDADTKLWPVLGGRAVLAFAGHDYSEAIVGSALREGILHGTTLNSVAQDLSSHAKSEYAKLVYDWERQIREGYAPHVELLLVGFEEQADGSSAATAHIIPSHSLSPFAPITFQFPFSRFTSIGRSKHGALYGLQRFEAEARNPESGLRLLAFTLSEICELDPTVGGTPQIYMLRKAQAAERLPDDKVSQLWKWAPKLGRTLAKKIGSG